MTRKKSEPDLEDMPNITQKLIKITLQTLGTHQIDMFLFAKQITNIAIGKSVSLEMAKAIKGDKRLHQPLIKLHSRLRQYVNNDLSTHFPSSSHYFLSDGKVVSTVQADKKSERILRSLAVLIGRFEKQKGHLPKNLNELPKNGYLKEIPTLPLGREYVYDPTTGRIDWK